MELTFISRSTNTKNQISIQIKVFDKGSNIDFRISVMDPIFRTASWVKFRCILVYDHATFLIV